MKMIRQNYACYPAFISKINYAMKSKPRVKSFIFISLKQFVFKIIRFPMHIFFNLKRRKTDGEKQKKTTSKQLD